MRWYVFQWKIQQRWALLLFHKGGAGGFIAVAAMIRAGAGLHMNGVGAAAIARGVIGAVFDVAPDVISA